MADLEASVDLSIAGALTRVAQLEAALKRATNVNLGGANANVGKAADDMQRLTANTEAAFRQYSRLAQVGQTMTKLITLPIVGAGVAAVALATQFDASMTNLVTRAGVAPAALGGIRKALLDMAPIVGAVPNELAKGLELIEGDGIHGAKALDLLRAAAEGSAIGLGSIKDVAAAVTTVINAYPAQVITASQATNVLTAAVKEGKVEASEMAKQLGRVAEPAALIGVTVDETAGAIAALSRVTGNASQATTDFAGLLSFLIKPSVQAQNALDGVGLSSHQLLDVIKQQGLLAALDLLRTKFGDNALALGQLFRNRQGLIGFLGLTQDFQRTTAIFGETAKGFRDSGKDIDGFSTVSQTAAFKFKQAMADIQKAGIAIGETIAPAAANAARGLAGLVSSFSDLPRPVKLGIEAVAGIAAIGGPILVAVGQVGKLQTAIQGMPEGLQAGVSGLTRAVGTAVSSLAGFTSAFVATQGGATQAALGFAGAAASIGVAFAVGGVPGGILATIATAGGLVAGAFQNSAKQAAEFKAAAKGLADTLAKDLTPAMQASFGFKLDLGTIGSSADLGPQRAAIQAFFDKAFNTNDQILIHAGGAAMRDFGAAVEDVNNKHALQDLEHGIAATAFVSRGLSDDMITAGVTVDELATATVKGKGAVDALFQKSRDKLFPDATHEQIDAINGSMDKLRGTTDGLSSTFGKANKTAAEAQGAVDILNVTMEDNRIAASRASSQFAGYGQGLIDFAHNVAFLNPLMQEYTGAVDAAGVATAGAGSAQADFIAQFGETKLPVGIGILDKLGLTVDDVAVSYKDLTKAAEAAQKAIMAALNIPLDAAQQQVEDARARQAEIDALTAAQVGPGKPTISTKTVGKTEIAALIAAAGLTGKKLTAKQIDALIAANLPGTTTDSKGVTTTSTVKGKVVTTTKKDAGGGGAAGGLTTDTTGTLDLTKEQGDVRLAVISRLRVEQEKYVKAIIAGGVAAQEAPGKYAAFIADQVAIGKTVGLSKGEMEAFLAAVNATPERVKTTIDTIGLVEALRKTDAYQTLLDSIDPIVATELQAATTGEARVAILVGYFNSLDPVKQVELAATVKGIADAQALKKAIDETKSKTVSLTVNTFVNPVTGGQIVVNPVTGAVTGIANGAIVHAADGMQRVPQIANGRRGGIMWAEPETGWEAYISGKPSMRARNEQILAETARRFGMEIYKQPRRFDSGGTINLPPVTVHSDPRMNALLERMSALLDQGGKGDVIVQVEAPAGTNNPDVFGARIGHAIRGAVV